MPQFDNGIIPVFPAGYMVERPVQMAELLRTNEPDSCLNLLSNSRIKCPQFGELDLMLVRLVTIRVLVTGRSAIAELSEPAKSLPEVGSHEHTVTEPELTSSDINRGLSRY